MKAMILAAGEGTRLGPLTITTPKVLLPVAGIPMIEHTLGWLKSHGIFQVAINLFHLSEKIRDFLGDGSHLGVNITYSPEEFLLGTAGGVRRMKYFFSNTLVVVYGDVFTNFSLSAMIRLHKARNPLATIAISKVLDPWNIGVVEINEERRVLNFVEKPAPGSEIGNFGNGGVYVLEKRILDYIPSEGFSDFAYDIFPKLIEDNLLIYGYVLKADDYLIDIGTLDSYQKANEDIKAGRVKTKK